MNHLDKADNEKYKNKDNVHHENIYNLKKYST